MKRKYFLFSKEGFSLIELLIIIGVIGILSSIVISSIGPARERARVAKAQADLRHIYNAIIMLESDAEEWPGHQTPYHIAVGGSNNEICSDGCAYDFNDCQAGIVCNPGPPDSYSGWSGPYMVEILEDPWGNDYFFDTDYDLDPGVGETWAVVIGSYGPNGQGNNQYDSDDVLYVVISQ